MTSCDCGDDLRSVWVMTVTSQAHSHGDLTSLVCCRRGGGGGEVDNGGQLVEACHWGAEGAVVGFKCHWPNGKQSTLHLWLGQMCVWGGGSMLV